MKTTTHFTALAICLALHAPTLRAQSTSPILTIHDAEVFEGNSGTTDLVFNVTLDRVSIVPVTASVIVSSVSLSPVGPAPASGGTAPGGSADFLLPGTAPITFRPGATTQSMTITVFGDATIEPGEILALAVQNIVGARTTAGSRHPGRDGRSRRILPRQRHQWHSGNSCEPRRDSARLRCL